MSERGWHLFEGWGDDRTHLVDECPGCVIDALESQLRDAREALRLLLRAGGCLAPDGTAEIREALSSQFDITLDQADTVSAALACGGAV